MNRIFGVMTALFITCSEGPLHAQTSGCAPLMEIARNEQKTLYLKNWMSEQLKSPDFLTLMNQYPTVRLNDQPYLVSQLGIDWAYLGLNSEFASVAINRYYKDRDDFTDVHTIRSISVGSGRSLLIMKTAHSDELGLDWPEDALSRIQSVNDEIYIQCD
jgi:hypothetical protein